MLRGGALSAADVAAEHGGNGRGAFSPTQTTKDVQYLSNAGVGAALSVNSQGHVVFAQMVPGMPAAKSGAINIGDVLVRFFSFVCPDPTACLLWRMPVGHD